MIYNFIAKRSTVLFSIYELDKHRSFVQIILDAFLLSFSMSVDGYIL